MNTPAIHSSATRRRFLQNSALIGTASLLASGVLFAQNQSPISRRKIRIGIAGGRFWVLFFWHEHPDCVVTAVAELRPERRELLMKTYKCAKSYSSLEEMVKDPNIDAIGVFTDGTKHFDHAMLEHFT